MNRGAEIIKYFRIKIEYYGLQQDKTVMQLFSLLGLNPEDKYAAQNLEFIISNHPSVKRKDMSRSQFASPVPQKRRSRDILIGFCENNNPIYFNAQDFTKGLLIGGATGNCKTLVMQNIQFGLASERINWISADFKMDYQGLFGQIPMVVLFLNRNGNFKYNPLQPIVGVPTDESDACFVNGLIIVFGIMQGARDVLLSFIRWLRKEIKHPNLFDLRRAILEDPRKGGRLSQWRESSLRAVSSLCELFPSIIDCEQGIDMTRLMSENNVVLDLNGAGNCKGFWSTILYAYSFLVSVR